MPRLKKTLPTPPAEIISEPAEPTRRPLANAIEVRGATQNNLKDIDVDIPLGKLTVITGPSGSGKSSLAFQTIYAEGQRRYVETFSPYTRQFFERMDKPRAREIRGIPPAIAIEQVNNVRTNRSTVGTITEINDYLKLLFPRIAQGFCPSCGKEVQSDTAETVTRFALEKLAGQNILVTFGVPVPVGAEASDVFALFQQQGYLRVRVFGETFRTDAPEAWANRPLPAVVDVVQDRLKVSPEERPRLTESVTAAFTLGKGQLKLIEADSGHLHLFSTGRHCPQCDITLREPAPGLFSFNHPLGACPECRGFGRTIALDWHKALPDENVSIAKGVVRAFRGETYSQCQKDLVRCCIGRGVDTKIPFANLPKADRDWVINGEGGLPEDWEGGNSAWYGVKGFFKWQESRTYKMNVRIFLSHYRSQTTCPVCDGGRLQKAAFDYRIDGKTLPDWWQLPVRDLLALVDALPEPADATAKLVQNEVATRLRYLVRVGLSYLTLDRGTRTLSGGEVARVNLTTCLGASLTSTLFVLDEPSIGLHQRDTGRLIEVIHGLRDRGNTVLVVEHEAAFMRAADHLVDIGPGRGDHGGRLVFSGPTADVFSAPGSLTAAYLSGEKRIPVPSRRRIALEHLRIVEARENNLREVTLDIPLGVFCAVSGVSGSGKSTLIHKVLYENLLKLLGLEPASEELPGACGGIEGWKRVGQVVLVDQSPIARTPRSAPAVFLGLFELIRSLFAATPDAKARALTSGWFSYNTQGGRCERCEGGGFEKIEMQFLSDLYVLCPECEGRRYKKDALELKLHGQSIADVLEMTTERALAYFQEIPGPMAKRVVSGLQLLVDTGLGYLRIGQPLNTLSGGESQRLKLVATLIESEKNPLPLAVGGQPRKHSLLIFDEPTTGLHFDDIAVLLKVFHRLVDAGHSLLVIEHNLDVIKSADWVLDLGPEAGADGGLLVAAGPPEEIAKVSASHTGRFLAEEMNRHAPQIYLLPEWEDGTYRTNGTCATNGDHKSYWSHQSHSDNLSRVAETSPDYQPQNLLPSSAPSALKNSGNHISIIGAREHNLKNLSLSIPRDQLVVVTGLSGSGKSTLAFDIIFAEGQRRFLDSMSPYARQFAEQLQKPDIDHIEGLPPTVAIEQRVSRGGGKSTVATVTEVYHFLRLLYAKLGIQHCPDCGDAVVAQTVTAIEDEIRRLAQLGDVHLMAQLIRGRKGFHTDVAEWALKQNYSLLLVDSHWTQAADFQKLARFKEHDIDAVILTITENALPDPATLRAKVEETLRVGKGTLRLHTAQGIRPLSSAHSCPSCNRSFEELDPRLFSFNSPHGWCPECRGYGHVHIKTAFDRDASNESMLAAELREDWRLDKAEETELCECPACHGARLRADARAVQLHGHTIQALANIPARETLALIEKTFHFTGREAIIARDILPEIRQRLRFMDEVGLGYLQLNRSARTLSGGEAQRIRLASQLGSNLRGVLYVLDEPTIGLHPRDNAKLLDTLTALRDNGNSVLMVEHDDETMRRADHILDLGPGAGRYGGEIIASGSYHDILNDQASLTAKFLREPLKHPIHGKRRKLPPAKDKPGEKPAWLRITGARANNLRDLTVNIPLARLTVLTGISGSGKSSFMRSVLKPAASAYLAGKKNTPASIKKQTWASAANFDQISAVYEVDQSPIGKTSRSTPATYVGLFSGIRDLFAVLPEARLRGFKPGHFSFNTEGGRCETCKGNGQIKLEMAFLPTSYILCDDCQGRRYNRAALEVTWNGKTIADVLEMSVAEAADFFRAQTKLARPLRLLAETGLGYLKLGQPSTTLSGGEAQRLKLVTELTSGVARTENARMKRFEIPGNLYLIEEPTIGLHMEDVRKLLEVLHRLVDDGHTVVLIEHHLDVIAEADFILDIGPEAGPEGGQIIAQGTPEQVAKSQQSRTAPFLREMLAR